MKIILLVSDLLDLSRDEIGQIHLATLEVLEKVGVTVEDDDVLRLLDGAGARVDKGDRRVRIPEYLVEEALRKVPSSFVLYSRDGRKYRIGADTTYTATGGGALWTTDLRSGEHRRSVKSDIEETCRLTDALENIDICEPILYPHDVPKNMVDVYATEAILRNSSKPYRILTQESKHLQSVIEMVAIVAGGMQELEDRPIFVGGLSSTSPLKLGKDELDVTCKLSQHKIPIVIMPCPMSGTTSPISLAGTLVTINAENIALCLVAEIVNPGTPIVLGAVPMITDMRTGFASMGAAESALLTAGFIDMAQFYNIPTCVTICCPDACVTDAQAGYESTWSAYVAIQKTASVALGAGMMNSALIASCEKLVMDNEVIGALRRIRKGIKISPETLAVDLIGKVGPGGHYLAEKHTREILKEEQWFPTISNRLTLQDWLTKKRSLSQAAREEALRILSEHHPLPLEKEAERELLSYVKQVERGSAVNEIL